MAAKKKSTSSKASTKAIKSSSDMLNLVDTSKLGKGAKIKVKAKPKAKKKTSK